MIQPGKPDAVLSDGTEVFVDLTKITQKEYVESKKREQTDEEEMATIAKVTGISTDKLTSLSREDYQKVFWGYIVANQRFTNPLSASESTI